MIEAPGPEILEMADMQPMAFEEPAPPKAPPKPAQQRPPQPPQPGGPLPGGPLRGNG